MNRSRICRRPLGILLGCQCHTHGLRNPLNRVFKGISNLSFMCHEGSFPDDEDDGEGGGKQRRCLFAVKITKIRQGTMKVSSGGCEDLFMPSLL